MRDYVKEYYFLILKIKDMLEMDRLFNFPLELQLLAQIELWSQGIKNLPVSLPVVDEMMDLQISKHSNLQDLIHRQKVKRGTNMRMLVRKLKTLIKERQSRRGFSRKETKVTLILIVIFVMVLIWSGIVSIEVSQCHCGVEQL